MMRIFKIVILAFFFITTLNSCLVEKKVLVQIARTTDNLRVYQAGDVITYSVEELQFSDFSARFGTLTIKWLPHAPLRRPGTTTDISVLEEVITLSFDGGATETGTVRYVSQDSTGEITLHAIQAPGLAQYYWLSTNDIVTTPGPTISFPIFTSPMGVGINPDPVSFNVIAGCDTGSGLCTSHFGLYSEDMNIIGDTTPISTNLGEFVDPFQINFISGTTIPDDGYPIIDVRNICGTNITTHAGTMYVMPEIGIIQMTNTCDDTGGDSVLHTIRIRSTSFNPFS